MKKPIRIQRKRTKGWQMPPNTVYVGRPTRWGNYLFDKRDVEDAIETGTMYIDDYGAVTLRKALEIYKRDMVDEEHTVNFEDWIEPLRGKNLACWCPLRDKSGKIVPCHADILLKIANE